MIPLPPIRRKSGKSAEMRKRIDTELRPLTEEFIFSTRRPKNPRPRTKPATTVKPLPSTLKSPNHISRPQTITSFPTPPPLIVLETTTKILHSSAFPPSHRKISSFTATKGHTTTAETTSDEPPTTNVYPVSHGHTPIPPTEKSNINEAAEAVDEHTINYKGITMSEDEFLKQLVRIVEAHQIAISKIEEQVEEGRRRAMLGVWGAICL
ncbi:unnamed protein product [Strongylus vulgaris]|uniref:Uncharacterized protein n=1 Tax=Strongylus vulgaris TaxID=40348 RepID=A0A3P7ILT1_STRVU|nr:unnamed protein product [Strongylus vulgaris]